MMKAAVEKAGLKAHYMVQPLAYHTPDCNCQGFIDLPEFPFGMNTLIITLITISYTFTSISDIKSCGCCVIGLLSCSQAWSPGF